MSDALSRFKHIQSLRGKIHDEGSENNPILQEVVRDTEIVSKWRESPDYEFSDYLLSEKKTEEEAQRLRAMSVSVSFEEVDALLNDLKNKWSENNRNAFLKQCQKESLYQIAAAFGMGKVIAAYDKEGGNVTTTHNARKDIYARDEDKFRREEYTGYDYTKASKNYRDSKISIDFTVQDEYTGKILYYKNQKNRSSVDADHIYPVKKYHQEGGFIQNKEQRNSFGSDPDNFAVTNYSINSSLQDLDKKNWMKKKRKDGSKKNNKEFYEINESFIDTAVQRGQCATKKHAPTNKDWAAYYTERTVATGIKESGKMGIQQASGALFIEFFQPFMLSFMMLSRTDLLMG